MNVMNKKVRNMALFVITIKSRLWYAIINIVQYLIVSLKTIFCGIYNKVGKNTL